MLHFLAIVALCMALVLFVQHQRDRRRDRKEAKRLEAIAAYHQARMAQLLSTEVRHVRQPEPVPTPSPPPPPELPRSEPESWHPPTIRWLVPAIIAICAILEVSRLILAS